MLNDELKNLSLTTRDLVGSIGQKDASTDLRADGRVTQIFVVDALAERHIGETPGPHPVDLINSHAKIGRLKAGGFHGIDDPLEDGSLAAATTTERGIEIKSLADGRALGHGGALAQNGGGRDRGDVGVGRDRRVGGKRLRRDESFALYVVIAAQHVILSRFFTDIDGCCWLAHIGSALLGRAISTLLSGSRLTCAKKINEGTGRLDGRRPGPFCCRRPFVHFIYFLARGKQQSSDDATAQTDTVVASVSLAIGRRALGRQSIFFLPSALVAIASAPIFLRRPSQRR